MRKFLILIFVAGSLLGGVSCNQDGGDVSIVGDVYMVTQVSGKDTLYGLSMHAYSLAEITTATVAPQIAPDIRYQLQAYEQYTTDFYYDTPTYELSKEKPVVGLYHFSATFKHDKTDEADDMLYSDVIYPPVITKSEYDQTQKKAVVQWNKVEGADVYVVKVYDGDDLRFLSSSLDKNTLSVSFAATSSGWEKGYTPIAFRNYQVMVSAFKFEPNGGNHDVQASTNSKKALLWGN